MRKGGGKVSKCSSTRNQFDLKTITIYGLIQPEKFLESNQILVKKQFKSNEGNGDVGNV